MLVGHDRPRRGVVGGHQLWVGVVERVAPAQLGRGADVGVVDVAVPGPLVGPDPGGRVPAGVVVDVVARVGDQVQVLALGDPGEGVEHVVPPRGAREVRHGQAAHVVAGGGGRAGAPDRRAPAQRLEGVVEGGRGGEPVGVDLDGPVASGAGGDPPPAYDAPQAGIAGDDPAHRHPAEPLRVADGRGVPAPCVGDGHPGPEDDPVGQGITGHHAVAEGQQLLGDGVGPAVGQPAPVAPGGARLGGRRRHDRAHSQSQRAHCCARAQEAPAVHRCHRLAPPDVERPALPVVTGRAGRSPVVRLRVEPRLSSRSRTSRSPCRG